MEVGKSLVWNNETLTIRQYDPKIDEKKVLDLWRAAFNNKIQSNLWRWKYIENPYKTAIMICQNSNGIPVVLYGGIPFISTYCGRQIIMIHLSDIMSHPDYRGSGLFIHTANAYFSTFGSMNDVYIMYGFPGRFHFDIGVKYLEYSPLGNGAVFLRGHGKNVIKFKKIVSGAIALFSDSDPCFDYIWSSFSKYYPLSVVRNRSYMTWRYFNHPMRQYEVWCYKSVLSKKWQAFVVIQIKEEVISINNQVVIKDNIMHETKIQKAVIVDMLIPNSEKIFSDFIGNIAAMLLKRDITTIETWTPDGHFTSLSLLKCGFEKDSEPIGIIPTVRLFDDELDMNWVCQNFYYTMGDGDLF